MVVNEDPYSFASEADRNLIYSFEAAERWTHMLWELARLAKWRTSDSSERGELIQEHGPWRAYYEYDAGNIESIREQAIEELTRLDASFSNHEATAWMNSQRIADQSSGIVVINGESHNGAYPAVVRLVECLLISIAVDLSFWKNKGTDCIDHRLDLSVLRLDGAWEVARDTITKVLGEATTNNNPSTLTARIEKERNDLVKEIRGEQKIAYSRPLSPAELGLIFDHSWKTVGTWLSVNGGSILAVRLSDKAYMIDLGKLPSDWESRLKAERGGT